MEEILYELRHHSIGLNCGRWDYLFSYIKKFKNHKDKITPDRSFLTMQTPLMRTYVNRLIQICHKRGTFAMGGMAAQIPIKNDPDANAKAMQSIEQDKIREVLAGCDGTWVAHPALVPIARAVFDNHMPSKNQIFRSTGHHDDEPILEKHLLELPPVDKRIAITSTALKKGISIVLGYTEAWLNGIGCIPLHHKMEDAATAEISRVQIWQWRHHNVVTQDDQIPVNTKRIRRMIADDIRMKCTAAKTEGKWRLAGKLVRRMLFCVRRIDFAEKN